MTVSDLFRKLMNASDKVGLEAEVTVANGRPVAELIVRDGRVVLVAEKKKDEEDPQMELFEGGNDV